MASQYTHDKNGKPLVFAIPHVNEDHTVTTDFPSIEDIAAEAQLTALGDFEALNFKITTQQWDTDQKKFNDLWRPFQPKEHTLNDRESIVLYGLETDTSTSPAGLSQYKALYGYKPQEVDMKYPTDAGKQIESLKEVFDYFSPIGRSYLLRLNSGGFFPPHRDSIHISRKSIRLIAFLGNECTTGLEWEVSGQRRWFQTNTVYYVDTRKMHRLNAWKPRCDMAVITISKTWANTLKIMSRLRDQ